MNKLMKLLVVVFASVVQVACVIQAPAKQGDPAYAPVLGPSAERAAPTSGSIYSNATSLSLFSDSKARRIGDIITIILSENTSSKKSSNVTIDKESTTGFSGASDGNTLLGTEPSFSNLGIPTSLTGTREFEGEADADQSNSLSGSISVTVADVLPNGNLIVRGEKWLTLNRGDEFIRVSGIVRPEDVSSSNTVMSQKLANAQISYSGRGSLADSGSMGWLGRVFNSPLWPF